MNKTILLVEYDTAVIESVTDLFSSDGYEFHKVEDGEAAKKLLEKKRFDLVITAAMLPKFHGFYLSQHIKEQYPGSSVIIISGVFKGYDYRQQGMTQYLADDYFEKPLDLAKLKKRANELLQIPDEAPQFDPSVTQIPKAKTNKIPTLKSLEQESSKLSSDDIFGDILKKIEKSSPVVKIDLEQPKAQPESRTPAAPAPASAPSKPITDREDLLKELVAIEEPAAVSPTVLLKKPINIDSVLNNIAGPKKEYKKLEDEISKKFEDTLSGLGLSSRPAAPKAAPVQPPPRPVQVPVTPVVQAKIPRPETGEEVGGYEILGPIARGGMAEIYKAKKKGVKGFEKIIALKKILSGYGEDQKYIEMFVDEAKIAAQLTHPNIVQIYDLGRKDDYYFIAMEYVEGKDLRLLLRQLAETEKYLPVELSVFMIIKVLEALYYAHTAKDNRGQTLDIVHRDVSPPNILIGYNGEVKLTDFGVSKASIKMHQTISGALKGKLLYMSPEQAKGDRNIDCRSDIFSAGVIFFEMLTNKKLFLDESEIQVLKKVQEGEITLPSIIRKDIDPDLEAILLKSLHKDPKSRYQTANEMAEALNAYLQKYYTQSPSTAHVAHYLMTQFADDIRKNNVKIDLKKEPYQITRRQPVVEKGPEAVKPLKVEAPKVEAPRIVTAPKPAPIVPPAPVKPPTPSPAVTRTVPQAPATATQKIPVPQPKPQPAGPSIRSDEEFTAMEEHPIEIDLSGNREEPRRPTPVPEPPPPVVPPKTQPVVIPQPQKDTAAKTTSYHEELALLDQESDTKKKFLLIAAAVVIVAIGLYFLLSSGGNTPADSGEPVPVQTETVPADQPSGEITADSTATSPGESVAPQGLDAAGQTSQNPLTTPQQTSAQPPISQPASAEPTPAKTAVVPSPQSQTQPSRQTVQPSPQPEKKPETTKPQPEKKTEAVKPAPITPTGTEVKEPAKQPAQQTTPAVTETKPEPAKEEKQPEAAPTPAPAAAKPEPEPVKPLSEGMEVTVNELDIEPQRLNTPFPDIPRKALKSIAPNTTILARILVNHRGQVEKVSMSKKTNVYDVDMAIISTLSKWTFQPGRKNNIAVRVWLTIPITLNQ